MAFDLSFITRPKCNGEPAANQVHQKNAGTSGTTGTTNNGAGLRVPEPQNKAGTFWDKLPKTTQSQQAAQQVASMGAMAKTAKGAGDSGNLSQRVPEINLQSGTEKPIVYAGVPVVPVVPAEKTSNLNAKAETPTQCESLPPANPKKERWAKLATAYHLHHFGCKWCMSGGGLIDNRCEVGAGLWRVYQDAE